MKELIQDKYLLNVWIVASDSNNQQALQRTNQLTVMKEHSNVRYVEKDLKMLVICLNIGKLIKPNE